MVSLCLCREAGESSSKQVNGSKLKKVITKVTLHPFVCKASSMLKGSRICNYFNDL
jgi:hypothetical protein